ncbi:E3 ubiquitin-protein ligase TRIM33-like [Mercenaria mercenaria]|uniref:E3 ubiquitin-protein ligase TRIM33-like n=1 Tax=Mercenaria mercenaria TaxID=6596 RepID=UPI00234EE117|nr:E3 ubiquitin-protein ligase TRIM33-like [Mercenaria mercenaria]
MATKEDQLQCDKELDVSSTCFPCLESGRKTKTIRYCAECRSYFCTQCLEDHSKFAVLRKHQIIDKPVATEHSSEKKAELKLAENFEVSNPCSPCSEVWITIEAISFCVECKSYLCEQCYKDHNKFAALRKHHIMDKSEAAKQHGETDQSKGISALECSNHCGQHIDSYCKDHDEVCCSICVITEHRSCRKTEKILKIEKKQRRKQFNDIKQSLKTFLEFANHEKMDRNNNLTDLKEEKNQILADIDTFEENITERIRVIAVASRGKVRATHAKHENAVMSDVKKLDTVISALKGSLNKHIKTNKNELQAFVSTKNTQKTLDEARLVVNDLSRKWVQTELCYNFNNAITGIYTDKGTLTFGDIIEKTKVDQACDVKGESNVKANMTPTHVVLGMSPWDMDALTMLC